MPGRKDAAWWRDYRARKASEQQESKGLQDAATPQAQQPQQVAPPIERVEIDTATQDVSGYDAGGTLVKVVTYAERVAKPRPSFLAAPDDDCGACGHDRQAYHLPAELPCRGPAPYARGGACRCPAFVDSSDPF